MSEFDEQAEKFVRKCEKEAARQLSSDLVEKLSGMLSAAHLAGRLEKTREDAEILREQLAKAKRQEQRVTLAIAIRAIERGRNLTDAEKMKNLMDSLAESDRANNAKLKDAARASTKEEE